MQKFTFLLFVLTLLGVPSLVPAASIDIYVRNVNDSAVSGAMVKLYDVSWNQVGNTKTTDSSGYVRFALLDYATYHYEVYYNWTGTEEFWGSDENISLQQPLITCYFTRNWPFKSTENIPSSAYVQQQVQIQITVKNNLSLSRNVKVELWVDRDQSSSWDFHEISSAQSVSGGGNTRVFTFNMTPSNSGTYYWRTHVLSYNDGAGSYIVTDTTGWGAAFTASYQTSTVDIYVENISGAKVEGAEVELDGDAQTTDSNGRARFTSVHYGTYNYEVYYNGTGIREFWGNDSIEVDASSESETFRRNWPYKYDETLPDNPNVGEQVQIEVVVRNNLSFSRNVKVELWVDRGQSSSWDFHEISSAQSVSGGGNTRVFTFNMTPSNSGTYYWRTHVLSYNDGAGSYIVTDTTGWGAAFTAQEALPEITDGRIAFHSYTEYDDENPSDGYYSLDGIIQVVDMSSNSHYLRAEQTIAAEVQHAMNPKFSEDGSKLVFMGLPTTRTYSHYDDGWAKYLDIFLYDFRSDNVVNLSDRAGLSGVEEDPSFSPDGNYVVFKNNRLDIYSINLLDYSNNQLTFDGTTSEESGPRYSPDGNWIIFWVGAGSSSYIAKVPDEGGSTTKILDNKPNIQDMYPSYWGSDKVIYTSWNSPWWDEEKGKWRDDDDIRIREMTAGGTDFFAATGFNSETDDSDVFEISDTLLGYSSMQQSVTERWDLFYGNPLTGQASRFAFSTSAKHDLGGTYTVHVVNYQPDTTPPDPDPITWATQPYDTGQTSISMVATTASDASGVEYYFDETSGNPGASDSVWQDSRVYEDTGLQPGTTYSYKVMARDRSPNQNTTDWSSSESATTGSATDATPPNPNPMTWVTEPYAASSTSISMVATTATDSESPPVSYFFNFVDSPTVGTGGSDSIWQSEISYTDTGLQPNHQYGYQVKARDSAIHNETNPSTPVVYEYTLSNTPGASSFSDVTETSIRTNWTANGNPSGTEYFCENTTKGTNSGWTTNTYWDSSGLACGTSYSFRVKAKNGDDIETGWTELGSQSTQGCSGDTTPPDTSITDGPSGTITYNDVTFTYTGTDNVTSTSNLVYSYKLDGYDSSWSSYASSTSKSYNDLPNDSYIFYVRAKDEAENDDPSPASRSFTVYQDDSSGRNVALQANGGTATAGSTGTYLSISYPAPNANDDDETTEWCNSWLMPDWLKIEFDQAYVINEVGVVWGLGAHNQTYSISLSEDGANWQVVIPSRASATDAGDDGGYHANTTISRERFAITPTIAHFIRIDVTDTSAPASHIFKAIVHELQAFSDTGVIDCTYSIDPTNEHFSSSDGTGSVSVSTESSCDWAATSDDDWITITSASSGSGNGTVSYSVSSNSGTSSRTGTMAIAGLTFTVTQSGPCTYNIDPTNEHFISDGGTGSVSVTTESGCDWAATSNDDWITITSASSGRGNGTVSYSVSSNSGTSSRTGTMTIAGLTFTVTQDVGDIDNYYVNKDDFTCDSNSPCYSNIQEAIDAAGPICIIKVVQGFYDEDVTLNKSKTLALQGGCDSTFTTQSSNTTINSLTVSNGTIVASNIILQPAGVTGSLSPCFYEDFLDRRPEPGTIENVILNFIAKNIDTNGDVSCKDFISDSGHTESVRNLITHFYETILGREPESWAVEAWEHGYFNHSFFLNKDVHYVAKEMGLLFFLSEEYKLRNSSNAEFIDDCSRAFLNQSVSEMEQKDWIPSATEREEMVATFAYSDGFAKYINSLFH